MHSIISLFGFSGSSELRVYSKGRLYFTKSSVLEAAAEKAAFLSLILIRFNFLCGAAFRPKSPSLGKAEQWRGGQMYKNTRVVVKLEITGGSARLMNIKTHWSFFFF